MERYLLEIYTWPACTGAPVEVRESQHDTPEAALVHLKAETEPYAYATLQKLIPYHGWTPCDWAGNSLFDYGKWPVIWGTNGDHPALIAYRADREYLRVEVKRRYLAEGGKRGTGSILAELMRERHPEIIADDNLAWQIAGELGNENSH